MKAPKYQLSPKACRIIPDQFHARYERAINKRSFTELIKLKCLDCCGWVKTEPALCDNEACALWQVRNFPKKRVKE